MPQIWFLGPRFRSQVQENVLDLGPMSWDYVLGTGKFPRIRLYVLENVLGLISRFSERSQIQVHYPHIFLLGPSKAPRFRSQVLEKFLDLGRLSPKCFQIQFQGPRKVLDLGPSSQKRSEIQVLSSRKCPRFRSYVPDLCPRSQKMSQI